MKALLFLIPFMAAAGVANAEDFRTSRDATAKALASAAAVLAMEEIDVVHWEDDQSDSRGRSEIGPQLEVDGDRCHQLTLHSASAATGQVEPTRVEACLVNQNTWLLDDRWIVAYGRLPSTDTVCESLRVDIRLDRGAVRMDAVICQAAEVWSVREWVTR